MIDYPKDGVLVEVQLLSNSGYPDMGGVEFPVTVKGKMDGGTFGIQGSEIIRIAGQCEGDPWDEDFWYAFLIEDIKFIEGAPMIKVRLLTDGGYQSMQNVPVGTIFDANMRVGSTSLVKISREDLIKAGADGSYFSADGLHFIVGSEVEIVDLVSED